MSVIGNPITLGGGSSDCVLARAGRTTSTTYASIYDGFNWVDNIHFDHEYNADTTPTNGSYICLKSGTYDVDYVVKGGYNGSGDFKHTSARLLKNGTEINSVTTSTTSGSYGTWTITLAAGDVLWFQQKVNWTSTLNVNGAYMIRKHHDS